ncbi:hypothetical protein QMK19_14300 [Streptomyces sp. H10-C2]|uniref:hypothetical protein n=1 Tax=unclassified Streptomyces TaxID=2593676 RepID=UPI0024BAF488|nr:MULTISPECIES: hypothetical protein [unclassified Streptomyces]MDJ0345043.1 hypothetical protein [Streptomyces sp. PH10-H1]MDJ0370820.1 hypothetical protein [Streptomyces sp. H10-C2]
MATTGDVTIGKLLMAEYDRLKEEQKTRIGFRDNLLYVTLAAMVTVLIGAAQAHHAVLLLALPVVTCVLGWTYLANDQKISAIGRYVRTDLGPRLGDLAGEPGSPFGWEVAHRGDIRRKQRKIIQCAVDLITFSAVPLAALVAFWLCGTGGVLPVTASILELLAVTILAAQIVLYAESAP